MTSFFGFEFKDLDMDKALEYPNVEELKSKASEN